MAEKTNTLQDLKNLTEYNELTGNQTLYPVVFILNISRYLSDPLHVSQTGLDTTHVTDVYQLTVTDSVSKRKVLLDPDLSQLVQNGQVKEGSCVKLEKCSVKFDETDLHQRTFLIVHQLSTIKEKQLILTSLECRDIPWCDDCDDTEKSPVPLSSSRGYFLNPWTSVEMEGEIWKKENPDMLDGLGNITPIDLYTIKEISSNWRHLKCPPILVKILCKKRILHYAKPNKNDKWPLQAHLTVCDRTGCATLVLWNSLCPEYYHRLQEGHVILVQRFTVKKSFHLTDNYKPTIPDGLQMYDIDINMNSHHPVSQIRVISPDTIPSCLKLPTLQYNFVQRKDLGSFPSDYICDIVGVIAYVGRFYREKMTGFVNSTVKPILCDLPRQPQNKVILDSYCKMSGYWISRWLELRDHTSNKSFVINVYRPAEMDVYDKIYPGCVIVCRHMRIVHSLSHVTTSRDNRSIYLTSTGSTCVHVITDQKISHHVDAVVTLATSGTIDYTMTGYFSYPPLPTSLTALKSYYEDLQLTTSENLQPELNALCYREHKRMFVQGQMVYIKYVNMAIQKRTRKASKNSLDAVVNDTLYQYFEHEIGTKVVKPPCIYKYSGDHFNDLLDFPSLLTKTVDTSDLDLADGCVGCFIIFWSGLNTKVIIPTIWMYNDTVTTEDRVENLLQNSVKSLKQTQTLNEKEITHIVNSAKDCPGHRFLLVLDIYKQDVEDIEIVLNSAYKL